MLIMLSAIPINVAARSTNATSWYIKRNGNLRPGLDKSQEIIYKYDGYYIDNKLSDDSKERKIYLTFDLGYSNVNTEIILDVLKSNNVKAAFFILDNIILKNKDLVTRMIEDGHLICNHTKKHKNLTTLTEEEIREDLTSLERLMEEKTGHNLSKYFRFPEGKYSESSLKAVKDLGYKSIFWSFAYADWDNRNQMSTEKAFKKVIENTHNGAVMLFHPTSKTNAQIFERLINEWKTMGYEFGTLDHLTK